MVRVEYKKKIQVVSPSWSLDTLVTFVNTPSSSTASNNTCIRNCLPDTLGYIRSPLGAPKTVHRLVAIVHKKQHSGRSLSHTNVLGSMAKGMV
jgi:hypothetical protein